MLLKKTFVWILVLCMLMSGLSSFSWAEENSEQDITLVENVPDSSGGTGDTAENGSEDGETQPENVIPEQPAQTQPEEGNSGQPESDNSGSQSGGSEPDSGDVSAETIIPDPVSEDEKKETEETEETEKTGQTEETEETAPERMAAAAGGIEYATVQEAVDAAASGDVYLLEFAQEDVVIGKNQSIVLHLNDGFYSGRITNFGELTVTADGGEGWLDGELVTAAYHTKDENGETLDFASGTTIIESGTFTGTLAAAQISDARLSDGDPLPGITVNGGNLTGAGFAEYYSNPDEDSQEPADGVGKISVIGGVFSEAPEKYIEDGYEAVYSDGIYSISVKQDSELQDNSGQQETPENNSGEETGERVTQPVFTDGTEYAENQSGNENSEGEGEQKNGEQTGAEQIPVSAEPEPEREVLDVDLFMYGSGSFIYEGEKYSNNDTIQVTSGEEPEISIVPDDGLEVRSVTVGANGLATAYGAVEEIQLEPVMMYTTVTAMLGSTPKYTVTYNYGTGAESKSTEMEAGEIKLEAAPEREEYQFRGWQCSLDSQVYEPGSTYAVSESVSFTALWHHLSTYTISYSLDGGTNSEQNPASYTEGSAATALSSAEKTGYAFQGWFTDSAFTTQITELSDTTVTGNLTLYAKFELNRYTITYDLDGGTNAKTNPDSYTVHDTVALSDASKPYYSFNGWYTDAGHTSAFTGITEGTTGDITVYAGFTPDSYTLTCMADGEVYSTTPFTVEDSVISIPDAVKENYAFKGWYTDPAFTESSRITSVDPASQHENLTVYAKLIPQYTISYVLNGGHLPSAASNPAYYTSEDNTIIYPTPYREDYLFDGWYTASDLSGSPVVSLPAGSSGNVTLYAKWEKIPVFYKVYVYYNTFGSVSSGGSVVPARSYFELEEGKSATLYFNPATASYYVYNCTVNGEKQGSISSYTINNIGSDIIISVTFVPTIARPMTGDSSGLALWAGLMAVSGAAAALLLKNRRRREK